MPIPEVRIRKETFGYRLAFGSGHVGFYTDAVAPLLLEGATHEELEAHRLRTLPVTNNFRLAVPLTVWLEITRACNMPCKHCYVEAGRPRESELTTEEIFSVLEQLKSKGVFALVLLGGEPMLHPDFSEIVNYAHDLGFVIGIATNGTYVSQEIIDKLPREECIVSVSLDGIDLHKEMRVKSTFEEVRERLFLLKRNNISTLTDQNVQEVWQLLRFAKENGFYFGSAPFSPIGRGRFFPQYQPSERIVEEASQFSIEDERYELQTMREVGLCATKFLHECYRLSQAMRREFCGIALAYILSDGSVYPCSVCSTLGKHLAGNVREKSFAEIWDDSFQEIRKITFDDFKGCETCELSQDPYFRTSRCPVMSEVYTGDPFECGSTPFLKGSLRRRTELINQLGVEP